MQWLPTLGNMLYVFNGNYLRSNNVLHDTQSKLKCWQVNMVHMTGLTRLIRTLLIRSQHLI